MLAMEKQRGHLPDEPPITASLQHRLAFLAQKIEAIEQEIANQIKADAPLAQRAELLRTIPGVGHVTAATLVAELPELGRTGKKRIAARSQGSRR